MNALTTISVGIFFMGYLVPDYLANVARIAASSRGPVIIIMIMKI